MGGKVLHCTEHNVLFWCTSPTPFVPWEGHGGKNQQDCLSIRFDLGRGGEESSECCQELHPNVD